MFSGLKQRLKPFYRGVWIPSIEAAGTFTFRVAVDLAAICGVIRHAKADAPASFLIVNLTGHLGDTVMMMPMIEALRRAHPKARIEVAAAEGAAPLLRQIEEINRVHSFRLDDRPPTTLWLRLIRAATIIRLWWSMRNDMQPTTTIVPRWGDDLFCCGTLAYLTQAPRRIGFQSDVMPGQPVARVRDGLLTEAFGGGSGTREAMKFVALLVQAGVAPAPDDWGELERTPSLALMAAAARVDWVPLAARLGIADDAEYAVIAPGASMARRVWPVENWVRTVDALYALDTPTVVLAGRGDAWIAEEVHAATPGKSLLVAGTTNLQESMAVLAHASIFMGNDSGPGHLAGALGVPAIVLFTTVAGSDPNHPAALERVGPIGPEVLCLRPTRCKAPCSGACSAPDAHCIRNIRSEEVAEAAIRVLLATSGPQPQEDATAEVGHRAVSVRCGSSPCRAFRGISGGIPRPSKRSGPRRPA